MILQAARTPILVLKISKKITFLLLNLIDFNFVRKMIVFNLINKVSKIRKETLVKRKWQLIKDIQLVFIDNQVEPVLISIIFLLTKSIILII
mgnify:CR=1 FL=1